MTTTLRTVTEYNGRDLELVIEGDTLVECLSQLEALEANRAPAVEEKTPDPTPAAPAATENAQPTPSEPASAPAAAATPSATPTTEPSSPEPATTVDAVVSGEDVLAAAKKLLTTGPEGEAKLKAALGTVGAQTVGTCPAEKRGDLLAAIAAELGA